MSLISFIPSISVPGSGSQTSSPCSRVKNCGLTTDTLQQQLCASISPTAILAGKQHYVQTGWSTPFSMQACHHCLVEEIVWCPS